MSPGRGPPAAIGVCLILPRATSSLTLLQMWRTHFIPIEPLDAASYLPSLPPGTCGRCPEGCVAHPLSLGAGSLRATPVSQAGVQHELIWSKGTRRHLTLTSAATRDPGATGSSSS